MIPSTVDRVFAHTADEVNRKIIEEIKRSLLQYSQASREAIEARLEELDREWDIERAIEAQASGVLLVGIGLAALRGKKWLTFPATVAGFLFLHAVQGWCPPVPILRRFGFRTASEIEEERYALKGLRGDLEGISVKESPRPDVESIYRKVAHHHNGHRVHQD